MCDYGPICLFAYKIDETYKQVRLRPISQRAFEVLHELPASALPDDWSTELPIQEQAARLIAYFPGIGDVAPNAFFVHEDNAADVTKVAPRLFCQFLSEKVCHVGESRTDLYLKYHGVGSDLLISWDDSGSVSVDEFTVGNVWMGSQATIIADFVHLCYDDLFVSPNMTARPTTEYFESDIYAYDIDPLRQRPIGTFEPLQPPYRFIRGSENGLYSTAKMILEAWSVIHGHSEKKIELTFQRYANGSLDLTIFDVGGSGFDVFPIEMTDTFVRAMTAVANENPAICDFDRNDKLLCSRRSWENAYVTHKITLGPCTSNHEVLDRAERLPKARKWLRCRGLSESELDTILAVT